VKGMRKAPNYHLEQATSCAAVMTVVSGNLWERRDRTTNAAEMFAAQ